jgi:biopolymer transport protein ExbD
MNKLKSSLIAVFSLILNGLFAQSNAQILPTTPITVNQRGNITLYGKKVELDNLRKELQNKLVKQATIPEEIQITYEGEVLMGMRQEVETQVSEAIAGAKWLKKSKPTVTSKSVTTTPTEFSGSKISVSVDKKGGITLTGKKVALEDLKKELQNQLVKLTAIPTEVPIKFDENILMGMRGAVRDEVNGAIKGAKWLKKKAETVAVTNVIHSFYKWYDTFQNDDKKNINFLNLKSKPVKLDNTKVATYHSNLMKSGAISQTFINIDQVYLKKCEAIWQKEKYEDGPLPGLDADRFFCAQDWDIKFWTTAPVTIEELGINKAKATIAGTEGGSNRAQKFQLVKENGLWLISKIECNMGIDVIIPTTPEQKRIEDLAAFYTGTLPCTDCDAIETLLTLNADVKRTFTLEEQYKGKKSKTVESNGTWAVTDGIVTLKGKTTSTKYQVTKEGLIILNTNGSKKDAALGKKYLLKKVLGE